MSSVPELISAREQAKHEYGSIKQFLASLTPLEATALRLELERSKSEDSLSYYKPYKKQAEFHRLGATKRERLLRAGNQCGKSFTAAHEWAYHLTGLYPSWWEGRRFDHAIVAWAAGETAEATRDNPQRTLLGLPGSWGTGAIPKDRIVWPPGWAAGTADLVDFIHIKHVSGRNSFLRFKYYAQGYKKWQGPPVHCVLFDEEPPEDIYNEGLARTIATGGLVALTFTPLQGYSAVVNRFLSEEHPDRSDTCMTIYDAEHINDKERKKIIASFPRHQAEARAMGIPTLGEGAVFPIEREKIEYKAFELPRHHFRICGTDFGWTHPAAFAWLSIDRDTGIHYVYDAWRGSEAKVAELYAVWKARSPWIPVAWPKDGLNETAVGPRMARQFSEAGILMLPEHATHDLDRDDLEASKVSTEAGVMQMLDMFTDGTLKIASHLESVFEEIRMYRRERGRLVSEKEDLISAIRYALMMARFAVQEPRNTPVNVAVPSDWRVI